MRVACALLLLLLLRAAAFADEAATARRFEMARRDDASLTAFLLAMPKGGDLHNHLTGAIYADYLLDEAVARRLSYDPATGLFHPDDAPGRVPAARADGYLDRASMRGWLPGAASGHDWFFATFDPIRSVTHRMPAEDILRRVLTDAREQNVQYLELMTTPAQGRLHALLDGAPPATDPEQALGTLQPALASYVSEARGELDRLASAASGSGVEVRFVMEVSRLQSDDRFFATVAAAFSLMRSDPRLVAMNMVGPEDSLASRTGFQAQMRIVDFLWRRFDRPAVTLHAGELTTLLSPVQPMRDRIRASIDKGHARRIGHGVSVAWERDVEGLLAQMRRDRVAVEICLTSNRVILGVSGRAHPIHLYRRAGVPFTINTDDAGVSRSTLTQEYLEAVRTLDLGYPELKRLVLNSLEFSFLGGAGIYQDRDTSRLQQRFRGVRDMEWRPPASLTEKQRAQIRLERALVDFER